MVRLRTVHVPDNGVLRPIYSKVLSLTEAVGTLKKNKDIFC
jgi:hypothetical protein